MNLLSTFLYARPSFAEGIGRILDFGDTLTEYNSALTPEQADYLALWADWQLVGMDMQEALAQAKNEFAGRKLVGQER